MAVEFIPARDMKIKKEASSDDEDLRVLISSHADRMKLDKDEAMRYALDFAELISLVESNGNPQAKNIPQKGKEASTASGLYQFVEGSVEPAVTRLERYIGMRPWMEEALQHKDASLLTPSQQTLLFLGDILEKKGSDEYTKVILSSGDLNAMKGAYDKLHHTKPDPATERNWESKVKSLYGGN